MKISMILLIRVPNSWRILNELDGKRRSSHRKAKRPHRNSQIFFCAFSEISVDFCGTSSFMQRHTVQPDFLDGPGLCMFVFVPQPHCLPHLIREVLSVVCGISFFIFSKVVKNHFNLLIICKIR